MDTAHNIARKLMMYITPETEAEIQMNKTLKETLENTEEYRFNVLDY